MRKYYPPSKSIKKTQTWMQSVKKNDIKKNNFWTTFCLFVLLAGGGNPPPPHYNAINWEIGIKVEKQCKRKKMNPSNRERHNTDTEQGAASLMLMAKSSRHRHLICHCPLQSSLWRFMMMGVIYIMAMTMMPLVIECRWRQAITSFWRVRASSNHDFFVQVVTDAYPWYRMV